jgi:hypothetical protein
MRIEDRGPFGRVHRRERRWPRCPVAKAASEEGVGFAARDPGSYEPVRCRLTIIAFRDISLVAIMKIEDFIRNESGFLYADRDPSMAQAFGRYSQAHRCQIDGLCDQRIGRCKTAQGR